MSKQLAPHQQRVVDEKRELDERREKLDAWYPQEHVSPLGKD